MPIPFTQAVECAVELSAARKDERVYVSDLTAPISVLSPTVTLDSVSGPFAWLRVNDAFAGVLSQVDSNVVDAVTARKDEVLGKPVTDEFLREHYKTFLDGDVLKVRVDPDVTVFDHLARGVFLDEVPLGARVRCALDLRRVCFGRAEWGAMWRLVQLRTLPDGECVVALDDEGPGEEDPEAPGDDPDLADSVDEFA